MDIVCKVAQSINMIFFLIIGRNLEKIIEIQGF